MKPGAANVKIIHYALAYWDGGIECDEPSFLSETCRRELKPGSILYWTANEESLQTKKILAKKILCKEKDAKKNIGNKSLILHLFQRKIAKIMNFFSNFKFFENIVT